MLFIFKRLVRLRVTSVFCSSIPYTLILHTTVPYSIMSGNNPAKRRLSTEHMELTHTSIELASKRTRESDITSPSSFNVFKFEQAELHPKTEFTNSEMHPGSQDHSSDKWCSDSIPHASNSCPIPVHNSRPSGSNQRSHTYPHPSKFHQPPLYGVPRPQPHPYVQPKGWQYHAYYRGMDFVRPYGYGSSQWGSSGQYGPPLLERGSPQEHGPLREQGPPRSHHTHPHRPRVPMRPMIEVNSPRGVRGWAEDGDSPPTLSLVTYNVLAQDLVSKNPYLYSDCPSEFLCWDYRKQNLLRELLKYSADILCLQEVEEEHFHSWFKPQLAKHGYEGIYQKRTGSHRDGSAIFYLSSHLTLLEWVGVQYQRHTKVLNRDNVGIIGKFAAKERSSQTFCVATTHLLFNPKAGDVKLAQLSCLLAELHRLASTPDWGLRPCLLCGDFNCIPGSPLLRFIAESRLDYSALSALHIAGYFRGSATSRRIPVPLLPPHLGINQDCMYRGPPGDSLQSSTSTATASNTLDLQTKNTDDFHCTVDLADFPSLKEAYAKRAEAIEQKTGTIAGNSSVQLDSPGCSAVSSSSANQSTAVADSLLKQSQPDCSRARLQRRTSPGVISHPFTFVPAYPHSGHRPSTITTYHQSAIETVDYIYFTPARSARQSHQGVSKGFHLVSRRALPSTHTLLELGPQPHQFLSSDHLALQANFQLL